VEVEPHHHATIPRTPNQTLPGSRPASLSQEVIMPLTKVRAFLDEHHIKYVVISHSKAYTAQGIAAIAHIRGQELAKTVIVKLDGALAMAVLPASYQVDLLALKKEVGVKDAALASEREFKQHFPDCETGAMPPFGNLYGIPVYVDETLTRDKEIAFNAGTHFELIRMDYADFDRLVDPTVMEFSTRHSTPFDREPALIL
jgi:Ala-tRNA(Pro) deacylase